MISTNSALDSAKAFLGGDRGKAKEGWREAVGKREEKREEEEE